MKAELRNHGPMRIGAEVECARYRMVGRRAPACEHGRGGGYVSEDISVIAMRGFDDGDRDTSRERFALRSLERARVAYARGPVPWNLMAPLLGSGPGTHVYGSESNCLDQSVVNEHAAERSTALQGIGYVEFSQGSRVATLLLRSRIMPRPYTIPLSRGLAVRRLNRRIIATPSLDQT